VKVLLISANIAQTPYPVYPLGASMIAHALRQAGHEVRLFDFLRRDCSLEAVTEIVTEMQPGAIGISVRNVDNVNLLHEKRYIDAVKQIVTTIRETTQAPVVLGGSGFSVMPEAVLERVGADYGVVGEGEQLAVELIDALAAGNPPAERCLQRPPVLCGSQIAPADYDHDILAYYLARGGMASVQTKRGCTHRCIYCSYPVLEGSRIRLREPSAVADDVERLIGEHGAHYIFFTDSVFNDEDGHYLAVVRELKRRGVQVPWTAFFKPGNLDEAAVDLMQETGLNAAEIGSDASTDTTLRRLGKDFLFADVLTCHERFARREISAAHYFMFGCPGETPETVREGIDNIRGLDRAAVFVFMGIRILPDTPLKRLAERAGILTPGQNLLDPVYYVSPEVDADWMEKTLAEAFAGLRHVVFPPDALESSLSLLHRLGFKGSALDILIKQTRAEARESGRENRSTDQCSQPLKQEV
jgi:lipid biosynthesis B12-binding/radical SAM protein